MIMQQRFNVLLQLRFYDIFTLIFFSLFEIVGNDILKIYELPKIDNKITKYSQIFI